MESRLRLRRFRLERGSNSGPLDQKASAQPTELPGYNISIFHRCMVWIEKFVIRDHYLASLGKPRDADQ